jgi:zinc transport system substrate-binding protein
MFRRLTLAALVASALPLPGLADVPTVIADTPVAQSFAAMVMGELGRPDLLLDRGGDPHHFQLRPSQARAVSNADLVIWSGAGLAPWMDRVVDTLGSGTALDLSAVAGLHTAPVQRTVLFDTRADANDGHDDHDHENHEHGDHDDHQVHDGHEHGADDDHAHDQDDHGHADHEHDEHEHGAFDPHLWLTPENAAPWLAAIVAQLSALDPDNAGTYAANAAAARADIDALAAELEEILAPVGDAGLVMYHAAYGYFGDAFGLNLLGTVTLSDAADPGAARIAQMRAALTDAGAVCIFPEVNHNPGFVTLVAEGSTLRIGAPLDPAGVMREPGEELYVDTMRGLAQAIADCVTAP